MTRIRPLRGSDRREREREGTFEIFSRYFSSGENDLRSIVTSSLFRSGRRVKREDSKRLSAQRVCRLIYAHESVRESFVTNEDDEERISGAPAKTEESYDESRGRAARAAHTLPRTREREGRRGCVVRKGRNSIGRGGGEEAERERSRRARKRPKRREMKVGESSWGPYYTATTDLWHSRSLFQHGFAEERRGRLVLGTKDARSASLHLGNAVNYPIYYSTYTCVTCAIDSLRIRVPLRSISARYRLTTESDE